MGMSKKRERERENRMEIFFLILNLFVMLYRMQRWFWCGLICGLLSLILCGGHKNGGPIPIIKNIWSLSYVLSMAGASFILLCICYYLIDVKQWWSGAPFKWVGMNSIVLYCGSELLQMYFPFSYKTGPFHGAILASNLIGTGVWFLIAYVMYKKKNFINI